MSHVYVPGKGNYQAKILIVGEAPSYREVDELTPFVGPSGRFLNELLSSAGINRQECWVTNVCKFMVPPNPKFGKKIPFTVRAKSVGIDIDQQINELRNEINSINPNLILGLGGTALWALTGKEGIKEYRGSILNGMGYKTVCTYHPAHILHQDGEVKGYWNKEVMRADLVRAKKQSLFREIIRPHRILQVAKDSHAFANFIERYKNHVNPAIDIEAKQCIPVCIGIAFTPSEGITIPLWNANGLSSVPTSELINLWKMLAEFLHSHDVVGQNFGYDRDKIRRLGFVVRSLSWDTMLSAFTINPELPKNLAFNTSIYTEEPYYKDEGMYEGSLEDLYVGCARDACVTKEIAIAHDADIKELEVEDYYRQFILPLHDLYFYRDDNTAIEQVGFRTNETERKALLKKYIEHDEKCRHRLYQLTGEYVNSNSYPQVKKLLFDKLKLPSRSGTGEEELTALLNHTKNPLAREVIELILEDRRVKKTISSYLYSPTDFDGRMRTSYFLCLETGRSSTQQQEPPIRPTVEYRDWESGAKKKQARGMAFQTITKHGDIGSDIRRMLVPDEGHVFIQVDSAQAEARVIFLLAEDEQALHDIDNHDFHALTASWFFGGTEDDYSKKNNGGREHPIRFAGKTLRHAGHLGAGYKRAATEVNTQARKAKIDYKISEPKAKEALEIFHKKQPKIRGVFQHEVIHHVRTKRMLRAPVPYGISAKNGGPRIFFERDGDELFRQAFSYLPQRSVSENTKRAASDARKRSKWIRILVEAHDGLLAMIPESAAEESAAILKEEMERPIDFSTCTLKRGELIIPCDVEFGYNYKDLSKFKNWSPR